MTIYVELYWPPVDLQAVCLSQTVTDIFPAKLNGTLANYVTNQISFIEAGFSRSVSITSASDNSDITFTVAGLQNGVPVSEDIVGPNATTVFGIKAFDVITSITVPELKFAEDVTIGTGTVGYLPLIKVDTAMHTATLNYAMQSVFPEPSGNTIKYSLYRSLAKIPQLGRSYDDLTENTDYFNLASVDVDQPVLFHESSVMNCYLFNITESTDTDFLRVIYMQVQ